MYRVSSWSELTPVSKIHRDNGYVYEPPMLQKVFEQTNKYNEQLTFNFHHIFPLFEEKHMHKILNYKIKHTILTNIIILTFPNLNILTYQEPS